MIHCRYLARFWILTCVAPLCSCATIGMSHTHTTERVVRSEPERVETQEPVAELRKEGDRGVVTVRQKCDVYSRDRIEVTKHSEAKNRSSKLDWGMGITGGLATGIGALMLADAKNVYPSDTSSRTYNSYGPADARNTGYVFLGLGGALLAVTAIDVIRAQGTSKDVGFDTRRGARMKESCNGPPVAGARVVAQFEYGSAKEKTSLLGVTDADGRLAIDVARLDVPSKECGLENRPFGEFVSVIFDGNIVGQAGLDPAYKRWIEQRRRSDASLVASAEAEQEACRTQDSCEKIKQYLHDETCYDSPEKRQRIAAFYDDASWEKSRSKECASSLYKTSCSGVLSYVASFPSGRHAEDGRSLIADWKRRRRAAVERLDTWARTSIGLSWAQHTITESTCTNRVDEEVHCKSAAAYKKSTSTALVTAAKVKNTSKIPITCGVGKSELSFLGGKISSDPEIILPGKSHIFKSVEVGLNVFFSVLGQAFGEDTPKSVACGVPIASLERVVPGVSSALGISQGLAMFLIITGKYSTFYGFFDKKEKMLVWHDGDIREMSE